MRSVICDDVNLPPQYRTTSHTSKSLQKTSFHLRPDTQNQ